MTYHIRQQRKGCMFSSEKRHRKDHNDNLMEAFTADLAEDAKQAPDMDKGPNPIQTSDLEIPNSKREESLMTGKDTRPDDKLIAEVDYPDAHINHIMPIMHFCNLVQDNGIG